jgi:hypothetical protein
VEALIKTNDLIIKFTDLVLLDAISLLLLHSMRFGIELFIP